MKFIKILSGNNFELILFLQSCTAQKRFKSQIKDKKKHSICVKYILIVAHVK